MSETKQELRQKLPSNQKIEKIRQLCGNNSELLLYWRDDLIMVVKKTRADEEFSGVFSALDDTIAIAQHQEREAAKVDMYGGDIQDIYKLEPNNINQLDFMAKNELNALSKHEKDRLTDVTMIYDVTDKGDFLRGYLSNGAPLDPFNDDDKKIISVMDKAFHSWLISHDMLSKDGIIYKNEPKDRGGNPTEIVSLKTLDSLLSNEKTGLDEPVRKLDENLVVTVFKQEKPAAPQRGEDNRAGG